MSAVAQIREPSSEESSVSEPSVCEERTSSQAQSLRFRHILVATDFSPASERAFEYAVAIARRYNARICVVHAIPPDPREPIPIYPLPHELDRNLIQAEQKLQRLDEKLDDLPHQLLLERGPVWDVLEAVIQQENIDLLVLGTRGRGGLQKLVLGSVAEEVLRKAKCAVLTVGPNVPLATAQTIDFKRILFAADFGPTSERALSYGLSIAENCGAKLVLLHMVPPMPLPDLGPTAYCPGAYLADTLFKWQTTMRDECKRKLRALVPPNSKLASEPEFVVGLDFLPEGVLDVANGHTIQLIIMGANHIRSPRVAAHIPLALTHEVICRAKCPVLTICNAGYPEEAGS